jgi:hypothetical protein
MAVTFCRELGSGGLASVALEGESERAAAFQMRSATS